MGKERMREREEEGVGKLRRSEKRNARWKGKKQDVK